ncbi:MAG: hypothetical protein IT258_12845 [Saprospiraceae bacterium]|nr:hypothetical protein [Saprospiraceae bacterium]
MRTGLAHCLLAQNPHGTALKLACASCHAPVGWEILLSSYANELRMLPHDRPGLEPGDPFHRMNMEVIQGS